MNKVYHIYTLSCPVTGYVKYVGLTVNPINRLNQHVSSSGRSVLIKSWVNELATSGNTPSLDVLETVSDLTSAKEIEKYWIHQFATWGFDLLNTKHSLSRKRSTVENLADIPEPQSAEPQKINMKEVFYSIPLYANLLKTIEHLLTPEDYIEIVETRLGPMTDSEKLSAWRNSRFTQGLIKK